jgi:hypothetical protein
MSYGLFCDKGEKRKDNNNDDDNNKRNTPSEAYREKKRIQEEFRS